MHLWDCRDTGIYNTGFEMCGNRSLEDCAALACDVWNNIKQKIPVSSAKSTVYFISESVYWMNLDSLT